MNKDNPISNVFKWFAHPFDWPREVYEDLRNWNIIRNMCKDPGIKTILKKNKPEIRFDKRYRLYTVINIPTELYDKQHEQARETYLIDELRKIESTTLKLGVSEILYPEYNIITNIPESYAYLLTLETDKESFSVIQGLMWLFKMFCWTIIILAINAFITNISGHSIIGWISQLFN
jgi:hypothetical protein